jgi:hypothetical protein
MIVNCKYLKLFDKPNNLSFYEITLSYSALFTVYPSESYITVNVFIKCWHQYDKQTDYFYKNSQNIAIFST